MKEISQQINALTQILGGMRIGWIQHRETHVS